MKERDKAPSQFVLEGLYNTTAIVAHVLGTDGDRPVSWWAWRIGSRAIQYSLLSIPIALPPWIAWGGAFMQWWIPICGIMWISQLGFMAWKMSKILRANLWRR